MPDNIEKLGPSTFGIERDFEIDREQWSSYQLLDGGKIRVKTSVQKIYQVVEADGKPIYDTNTGLPVFAAAHRSDVVFSK